MCAQPWTVKWFVKESKCFFTPDFPNKVFLNQPDFCFFLWLRTVPYSPIFIYWDECCIRLQIGGTYPVTCWNSSLTKLNPYLRQISEGNCFWLLYLYYFKNYLKLTSLILPGIYELYSVHWSQTFWSTKSKNQAFCEPLQQNISTFVSINLSYK